MLEQNWRESRTFFISIFWPLPTFEATSVASDHELSTSNRP